jgi:hypothetical protein
MIDGKEYPFIIYHQVLLIDNKIVDWKISLNKKQGKWDWRNRSYYHIKEYKTLSQETNETIVNNDEEPSNEKPFGLYGIPIMRDKSGTKIGATMIREMVQKNELEKAKDAMAPGDEDIKDQIIDSMIAKMSQNEEYFDIEGFKIDKMIISDITKKNFIDPSEAMMLILDILQTGE